MSDAACYLAYCPECDAQRGITVIDPEMPETLKQAVKDRKGWEKDGYRVVTTTVDEWNSKPPDARRHTASCSRRAKAEAPRPEQHLSTAASDVAQKQQGFDMSTFSEWEMNGGVDPYTAREQQEHDAEAEHVSPCGCHDPRCAIDDRDATNVNVNGTWFSSDCAGLCWVCGAVDDLRNLLKVSSGRFVHAKCPDMARAAGLVHEARLDEARDDFNLRRR